RRSMAKGGGESERPGIHGHAVVDLLVRGRDAELKAAGEQRGVVRYTDELTEIRVADVQDCHRSVEGATFALEHRPLASGRRGVAPDDEAAVCPVDEKWSGAGGAVPFEMSCSLHDVRVHSGRHAQGQRQSQQQSQPYLTCSSHGSPPIGWKLHSPLRSRYVCRRNFCSRSTGPRSNKWATIATSHSSISNDDSIN